MKLKTSLTQSYSRHTQGSLMPKPPLGIHVFGLRKANMQKFLDYYHWTCVLNQMTHQKWTCVWGEVLLENTHVLTSSLEIQI